MKQTKRKQHFSIMEVIVVMAVMMTVMSIIFSAMKTSSDLSKKVTCMSNIAQIRAYTELYRKDHGMLPYSNIWLTDFSYAADYMSGTDGLGVFTCPGSDDDALTTTDQLTQNTSYYYVPARAVLEENLADGSLYGFSLINLNALANKNQLVIYDKSPDHHNGKINIAYLYGDDEPQHELEGQIADTNSDAVLALDGSGQLTLEDATSFGTLNINPGKSDNTLFTLTDRDGNIITVRTDTESATGTAVNITLKVKNTDRTLEFGDDEVELKTNATYDITATSTDSSGSVDPYYIYELTHSGNGTGQWTIDIYQGIGGITVTNTSTGESWVLDGVAD